ncbi:putative helicase mov-10-B.2 [Oryzias melastigma]|uniref:putative helicase mov-10-B.2 n=1 Tax=Oryzias melastigma TaxID=30732 RepID=UPI000CF7C35A|nr:putative helicase mov-10-B.2 [Oryzias melastigma]
MTFTSRCQIGLDFFEYLTETNRTVIDDKIQLRDIYNNEFRTRILGKRDSNFSSVLYAMKICKKAIIRGNKVSFTKQVKAMYVDQWSTSSKRPRQPTQNQEAVKDIILAATSSPEGAETGVRARRKLAHFLVKKLAENRTEYISDKPDICIISDCEIVDGKYRFLMKGTYEGSLTLSVKNIGQEVVFFTYYTPLYWLKCLKLSDAQGVTKQKPLQLSPGDCYNILVEFRCNEVGYYPATLAFEFKKGPQKSSDVFHIVRTIEAQCVTSLGLELGAEAPYRANSLPAWTPQNECRIVDGQPPEGLSVMKLKNEVQLKQYKVPQYMEKLIEVLKMPKFISESRKRVLESPLSWENYAEKFHLMLYLEELQMEVDIRSYNIPNSSKEHAVLSADPRIKHLLVLEVPGVSENRPSVLRGDALLVYPQGETGVKYRGYVHGVLLDSVKLGFASEFLDRFKKGKDFSLLQGIKFNVEFVISRLILRLQHRAAELALTHQLGSVLFPDALPCSCPEPDLPQLKLFDRKLEKNPEQYRAVQQIVTGSSRPAPYLVFGPPGTGKTVTVVEAIKQIEKFQTSCRILACAPSNSAADLLCRKILEHVDNHKVYRMYASSRDPKLVPDELKDVSNLVGECYEFPTKEKLMEYKIMVTTLLTAGRLVSGAIPVGHFTHVFVDEAGHAVETECLVPLAGLLDPSFCQLVLAGDPKQLGPILRSPFALKYGMGESLLERLMKNFPLYQKNEGVFNSRFVTKLLRNYRSHPAILKIPNELFYDGELQPCAEEYSRSSYCYWRHLPKTDFPVIFHGVAGRDERENTSPSFFNVAEIEVLMDYVQKLLEAQGKKGEPKIAPKDIGIIAPYRKQVQKIRRALEKVAKNFKSQNMNALKVGSVEEFQGQERRVILVSTVRSSSEYMEFDKKFSLGFVKNEKRFNVAVTRAQALLIVVGNPVVLKTDHTWARFLQYCKDEGGDTGFKHEENIEDVEIRFAALCISMESHAEETDESAVQRYQSPEWRHDI